MKEIKLLESLIGKKIILEDINCPSAHAMMSEEELEEATWQQGYENKFKTNQTPEEIQDKKNFLIQNFSKIPSFVRGDFELETVSDLDNLSKVEFDNAYNLTKKAVTTEDVNTLTEAVEKLTNKKVVLKEAIGASHTVLNYTLTLQNWQDFVNDRNEDSVEIKLVKQRDKDAEMCMRILDSLEIPVVRTEDWTEWTDRDTLQAVVAIEFRANDDMGNMLASKFNKVSKNSIASLNSENSSTGEEKFYESKISLAKVKQVLLRENKKIVLEGLDVVPFSDKKYYKQQIQNIFKVSEGVAKLLSESLTEDSKIMERNFKLTAEGQNILNPVSDDGATELIKQLGGLSDFDISKPFTDTYFFEIGDEDDLDMLLHSGYIETYYEDIDETVNVSIDTLSKKPNEIMKAAEKTDITVVEAKKTTSNKTKMKEAKNTKETTVEKPAAESKNPQEPTLGNVVPPSVIKDIDVFVTNTLAEIDKSTSELRAVKKNITSGATATDEDFKSKTERISFLLKQLSRISLFCSNTIKAGKFDKGLLYRIIELKS